MQPRRACWGLCGWNAFCPTSLPTPPTNPTPPRPRLRTLLARAAAHAAAALAALLPAGAARAMDALAPWDAAPYDLVDPDVIDAVAGDETLLEVMLVVVACYVGLIVGYLWLASMIDGEVRGAVAGSGLGV